MKTLLDAQNMAKTLRAELAERDVFSLSYANCLDIVARQFGCQNWEMLSAQINQSAKYSLRQEPTEHGAAVSLTEAQLS
ncbi:hypothetical protein IFT84_03915 [Rhizobium sp. CFBP 8762]|uniref:glyoxalase superfamily protein n=1 Tax=Rhizobium sp. CFBP 8762 TaxID=2775279 RepID=UPI001781EEC0|nr:hypothetical protein [Rhizobium sp. CFBP 8762]